MITTNFQYTMFVLVIVVVANVLSASVIWWDKRQAMKGNWRVKESYLLVWALVGGWPGGIWAMGRFRHKTAKRSFMAKYVLAVILNLAAVAAVVYSVLL